MTDRFIDVDETQVYGPYTSRKIRERVVGLVPEFDTGLERLAKDIDHATVAIHEALEVSRSPNGKLRSTVAEKGTVLQRATGILNRFSKHLDTHDRTEVDRKRFFPENGTATGVGKTPTRIAIALGRISSLLGHPDYPVRSKDEWLAEFKSVIKSLTPMLDQSNNVRTDRLEVTPELEAARQAWLQVYSAGKCGVECVFRLTGNVHLMPIVFHDLAVQGNAKVTNIPEPPPEVKNNNHV